MRTAVLNSKSINETARFEAKFFLNEDAVNTRVLLNTNLKKISLNKIAQVFNPPIFKRRFCVKTQRSVIYCQSSDVSNASLDNNTSILREQVERIKVLVQKDWILITGFGTIGNTRLVSEQEQGIAFANNVCRVVSEQILPGYLYAFLTSKFGRSQFNQNATGSVVRYIEAPEFKKTIVPLLSDEQMNDISSIIERVTSLRQEAILLLTKANAMLMRLCRLSTLTNQDYEFFGANPANRQCSTFNIKKIDSASLAAFNYSQRIARLRARVAEQVKTVPLTECLEGGKFFSTGSFKRLELDSPTSIELINQSDIFDNRIKGKQLARKYAGRQRLVDYGEVLIAGVGTLGENETFCRALFAGEELQGKLISGEFIRMNTNGTVPAGYLYAWLASDYGFRMIRATQAGTKLCRPIPKLLAEVPVPILSETQMHEIHQLVTTAHTKRYEALQLENQAIAQVETAIAAWQ